MHNPFDITYKFLRKNWKVIFLLSAIVGVVYLIIEKIFTLITTNPFDFSYFYSIFFLKLHHAVIPTYSESFIFSFWIKVVLLLLLISLIISFFIRLVNIYIVETTGLNRNQFPGQPSYHDSFNSVDPIDHGLGTGLVSGYSTKFDNTKVARYAHTRDRALVLEGLFAATAYNNSQRAAQMRTKQVVTNKWLFRLSQLVPFTVATLNKTLLPLWLKTFVVSVVFFISSFIITLFFDGIFNQLVIGQHSQFYLVVIFIVWILALCFNAALLLPALSLSFFRKKYNPLDIFATSFKLCFKYKKSLGIFTIGLAIYTLFTHLVYHWIVGLFSFVSLGLVGVIAMYGLFIAKYFALVVFALVLFHIFIRSGEQDAKTLDQKYHLFISTPDLRMMRLIMHKRMILASTTPYYQQDENIKRIRGDYMRFDVLNSQHRQQAKIYAEKDRKLQNDLNEFVNLSPRQFSKAQPFNLKTCLCTLFSRNKNKPKLSKAERAKAKAQAKALAKEQKAQAKANIVQVRTKGSMTASTDNTSATANADNIHASHANTVNAASASTDSKPKLKFNLLRRAKQKNAREALEKKARNFQTQESLANSETDDADKL